MSTTFRYKGYLGSIEADIEGKVLFGTIIGINDLISFQGDNLSELESAFKGSVDDYIKTCKALGKDPEKFFPGVFNVRIKPELHKEAVHWAAANDTTLNHVVEKAIENYIHD
jgi:predicted HicB family RNase H-like nuclease